MLERRTEGLKILRVNMSELKVTYQDLPVEWKLVGGRGLIAKVMNKEVRPDANPLGPENKLIIAAGPLAGTMAPQLGRISVGGKSPLTLGIKEANAGGIAAQKLDKLGVRAIVVDGAPEEGNLYLLKISKDGASFVPADEYKGMGNYRLAEELHKKYGDKPALISISIAGERKYKSASVAVTDVLGDPSRSAGRGGMGAVMGSKGLKAIIVDDSGVAPVTIANQVRFKQVVRDWVDILRKDVGCGLFHQFGTSHVVTQFSYRGVLPYRNYSSGRPEGFMQVSGEAVKNNVWARGGKMHSCMPGCVVQCSIIYNDAEGRHICSAYEYEAIGLLGTNLGIVDLDAVGRLKFICDDLGIDFIEIGSAMGVAASAGKMEMGSEESATKLLREIEQGTEFGSILAEGVVSTAKALNVSRIPAFKGQAIPAHDGRAVKGIGVTYATSPMGADHTAGLTYRNAAQKTGQIANSLRSQIQAATWDTLGYCLNSVPGGQASTYGFLADLLNARYGLSLTADDVVEIGKQTLKDELAFNRGAEFSKVWEPYPQFFRTEALPPTNSVFDVEDSELESIWGRLDAFKEPKKIWEVRFSPLPPILFGAGVVQRVGERAKALNIKKALFVAGPIMKKLGLTDEVRCILEKSGVNSVVFSEIEPDPPVEEVNKAAQIYVDEGCDGIIAMGGGSSLDVAKGIALKVSHPGPLTEYGSMVGGAEKITGAMPPLICIPTTSGTGSEVNPYTIITDKQRDVKFIILSDRLVPALAVVDPNLCRTMPKGLTAETGVDALAHCIEGYVGQGIPYHPYYSALALYGVKLVGKNLRRAYNNPEDVDARSDMCVAAIYGGISFTKGLGIGHALGHVIGARYHISHGKAVAVSLLCFARANKEACKEEFLDLAWTLGHSDDLEAALEKLYNDLNMPIRFSALGIPKADLGRIAFEATKDVVNLAGNPAPLSEQQILELLNEFY
jgi:aldehyde:ferredoxin oxidoreductase